MIQIPSQNRRDFLSSLAKLAGASTIGGVFPAAVERALAIPAARRTGTIRDVEHIVILTQENRSFDHYFGAMGGVRGFADPFPIPVADTLSRSGRNVWHQPNDKILSSENEVVPFHLNTETHFEFMRVKGTPHTWTDAQSAWDNGSLGKWTIAKRNHSMGYFAKSDIPFQWALAEAFTICDAYHCSLQAGTNPNRLFIWTGTNDPQGLNNGPATHNEYDSFDADPGQNQGYSWTTYPERLEAGGVSWQIYQDMADNFTNNPLAGFKTFRDAWFQNPGYSQSLRERALTTRALDALAADVLANRLPQVSWIIADAAGSEHPDPSSPAQGADYIARVLNALTANPEVWSKTVLFINFDENDGFFDHMPPPAPPSYESWHADPERAVRAGKSTVDASVEYNEQMTSYRNDDKQKNTLHQPFGLGPRVPLYVISPWSKGGWVNSQVFDHTSIIRFVETRFGVREQNISAWRRAVTGDLTSAFDFSRSAPHKISFPGTTLQSERARALKGQTIPKLPSARSMPIQESLVRPSRALPYELHVASRVTEERRLELQFANTGTAGVVFHVYDRLRLGDIPRRYTVEAGQSLNDLWEPSLQGLYDIWVHAPNGFHRHFCGNSFSLADSANVEPEIAVSYLPHSNSVSVLLTNSSSKSQTFFVTTNRYKTASRDAQFKVSGKSSLQIVLSLSHGPWYDFSITMKGNKTWGRRFAGRMELGVDSFSDPAMGGSAISGQYHFGTKFPNLALGAVATFVGGWDVFTARRKATDNKSVNN